MNCPNRPGAGRLPGGVIRCGLLPDLVRGEVNPGYRRTRPRTISGDWVGMRARQRDTLHTGDFFLTSMVMCDVTRILGKIEAGDLSAAEQLLPLGPVVRAVGRSGGGRFDLAEDTCNVAHDRAREKEITRVQCITLPGSHPHPGIPRLFGGVSLIAWIHFAPHKSRKEAAANDTAWKPSSIGRVGHCKHVFASSTVPALVHTRVIEDLAWRCQRQNQPYLLESDPFDTGERRGSRILLKKPSGRVSFCHSQGPEDS